MLQRRAVENNEWNVGYKADGYEIYGEEEEQYTLMARGIKPRDFIPAFIVSLDQYQEDEGGIRVDTYLRQLWRQTKHADLLQSLNFNTASIIRLSSGDTFMVINHEWRRGEGILRKITVGSMRLDYVVRVADHSYHGIAANKKLLKKWDIGDSMNAKMGQSHD